MVASIVPAELNTTSCVPPFRPAKGPPIGLWVATFQSCIGPLPALASSIISFGLNVTEPTTLLPMKGLPIARRVATLHSWTVLCSETVARTLLSGLNVNIHPPCAVVMVRVTLGRLWQAGGSLAGPA